MYHNIPKLYTDVLNVIDMEDTWMYIREAQITQGMLSMDALGYSCDNIVNSDVGDVTTGTIVDTITSNLGYCYYMIFLKGDGDMSGCTVSQNRAIVKGSEKIGRMFSIDETSFTYTITVTGTVTIRRVIVVGIKYGTTLEEANYVVLS